MAGGKLPKICNGTEHFAVTRIVVYARRAPNRWCRRAISDAELMAEVGESDQADTRAP